MESKKCVACNRILDLRMFIYDSSYPDRMSDKCRTCKSYRKRQDPSLEEVDEYEDFISTLITKTRLKLDPIDQRIQFTSSIYQAFKQSDFNKRWRAPVWIDKRIAE